MPNQPSKYTTQRTKVAPPVASLTAIRNSKGMTLDAVCERMTDLLDLPPGKEYSRGALSAIENGHRGASTEVIKALEVALDLRPGDLVTNYEPTENTRRKAS